MSLGLPRQLATDLSKAVVLVGSYLMLFGVCVSCCVLYSCVLLMRCEPVRNWYAAKKEGVLPTLPLNLNLYVAGPFSVDATGRELGEYLVLMMDSSQLS